MSDRSFDGKADGVADGVRYRRLRLLGCAPDGSRQHKAGTVLRFQALDDFVDLDIAAHPERGDDPFDLEESQAEQALREIASFLGIGGHNAPVVDVAGFKAKILEAISAVSTDQPEVREQQAQADSEDLLTIAYLSGRHDERDLKRAQAREGDAT